MQVKKQQLEPYVQQQTGSNFWKVYVYAVYCHPVYLTSMQSILWEMPSWNESQAGIKIAGRNINSLRYTDEMKWKSLSHVQLFATSWTAACQDPLSMDSPGQNTGVGSHFFCRGSLQPRNQTQVSCTACRFFAIWATREAPDMQMIPL